MNKAENMRRVRVGDSIAKYAAFNQKRKLFQIFILKLLLQNAAGARLGRLT